MKKVAFIIALALVFLVGITTVLKHKVSAQPAEKPDSIVLWIPIDASGNVVFEKVNGGCNVSGSGPHPHPDPGKYTIEFNTAIFVTKTRKNPYCYWVYQGGSMVERCF